MQIYQFKAMDKNGREFQSTVEAISQADAEQQIRDAGHFLTKIAEAEQLDDLSRPTNGKEMGARETRYTFGLPAGSVRAMLTLLVVAIVVTLTIKGIDLRLIWSETLMIALAHYFTSRTQVSISAAMRQRLIESGEIVEDDHPLYLPKNTIRTLIILALVGLTMFLLFQGRQLGGQTFSIILTIGAYLFGNISRSAWDWWTELNQFEPANWIGDLKALLTVFAMSLTFGLHLFAVVPFLPIPIEYFENTSICLALFYFGSR